MNKLHPHKYAELFPMMNDEEYKSLVSDMKESGYDKRFPIILLDGKILDGRNRYRAALEAKINPTFEDFVGDNALDFVIRSNVHRRHLNESQRGLVARRLETLNHGQRADISRDANLHVLDRDTAASMLNVSSRTVATIKSVERDAPELIEKIESGEMTAHEASKVVKEIKKSNERKTMAKSVKNIVPSDLWKLYHGDMREVGKQIPDNSVDVILTDPPYPSEFLHCWDSLAELADRVLKPSGFLFAYSGQLNLPEAMRRLANKLNYYWTMSLEHAGNNQLIMPRNVFCGWKPILIYQKSPFKRFDDKFSDVLAGGGREKGLHDWQQAEGELDYIIKTFTIEGETILDPFVGSGTTMMASLRNKRYSIGIEIEEEKYLIAYRRLSDGI